MKSLSLALAAVAALTIAGVTTTAADAAPRMKRVCKMVRGPHHHMVRRCTMVHWR